MRFNKFWQICITEEFSFNLGKTLKQNLLNNVQAKVWQMVQRPTGKMQKSLLNMEINVQLKAVDTISNYSK